jgi:hypothetical protein
LFDADEVRLTSASLGCAWVTSHDVSTRSLTRDQGIDISG